MKLGHNESQEYEKTTIPDLRKLSFLDSSDLGGNCSADVEYKWVGDYTDCMRNKYKIRADRSPCATHARNV